MLCQDCTKRDTCTELCEDAEKYVNRDHVSQKEIIVSRIPESKGKNLPIDNAYYHAGANDLSSYFTESQVELSFLTPLQNKCLHLFYFEGLTYAEIAQRVNCRVKVVDHCIYNARRKIRGISSKVTGE